MRESLPISYQDTHRTLQHCFGIRRERRVSSQKVARLALRPFLGRRRFQPLFELLHKLALAGLNLGHGGDPEASGERAAARTIAQRFGSSAQAMTVFDVGANVGDYTAALRAELGNRARIWSFEPAPGSFEILASRFSSDELIEIRNVGFSDEEREAELFMRNPHAAVGSLYRGYWGQHDAIPVRLTTVDAFCDAEGVDRIHLLKLDTEGHELAILRGANRMLEDGKIEAVQLEFGTANVASRTFLRDFFDVLGPAFDLHRVILDGLWLVPAHEYRHEVFAGATNYVAIRKQGAANRRRPAVESDL
jgi:FkbM family methyltransferase